MCITERFGFFLCCWKDNSFVVENFKSTCQSDYKMEYMYICCIGVIVVALLIKLWGQNVLHWNYGSIISVILTMCRWCETHQQLLLIYSSSAISSSMFYRWSGFLVRQINNQTVLSKFDHHHQSLHLQMIN